MAGRNFRFCIDRGGTFTDIYAEVPDHPGFHALKLLSVDPDNYEDAPREGIRRILEAYSGISIPRSDKIPTDRIDWIRMGTTVATNALLERKGERTALVVSKGFRDLLKIGNQARPKIFDLSAARPSPLYEEVIEADERVYLESGGGDDDVEDGVRHGHGGDDGDDHVSARVLASDGGDGDGGGDDDVEDGVRHGHGGDDGDHHVSAHVLASDGGGGDDVEDGVRHGHGGDDGGGDDVEDGVRHGHGGDDGDGDHVSPHVPKLVRGLSGELVQIVRPLDEEKLKPALQSLLRRGIRCLAVVFLHSYTFPYHEQAVERLAKQLGFKQVSISSALVPMIRAVPRGLTAVVDAYLTPVIKDYLSGFLSGFDEGLDKVAVSFMQSDGGLTPEYRFSGHKAILSGPAGGVVGYARTTFGLETSKPLIGFDMGGTSTDVSRYAGSYEQVLETQIAGAIIQAPQLDINTVAAGGGSKLKFQVGVFKVGPDSVGAHPGPVCYRKGGELAVTDANVVLGRVVREYFPSIFGPRENEPLDVEAARKAFGVLCSEINAYRRGQDPSSSSPSDDDDDDGGGEMGIEEVALGFLQVANEAMCRPIRELTEMKGYETAQHALSCFGGAGPQHACAIAKALGIKEVFVHRYCGILSAYGLGLADVIEEAQEPFSAVYGPDSMGEVLARSGPLSALVKQKLKDQGFKEESIKTELMLNLRYDGTDTILTIAAPCDGSLDFAGEFVKQFRREYGFELQRRSILINDVRVQGVGYTNILKPVEVSNAEGPPQAEKLLHKVFFAGGWRETPIYVLEKLGYGHILNGPCIVINGNSTIVVEPGCRASITKYGNVKIEVGDVTYGGSEEAEDGSTKVGTKADVVLLSIFNNRFMGIAEQMGRTLQRTSISTNIKERLDFSCALFGPDGGLVANAPHVPVHLGAMSSTIKWQMQYWGDDLEEGDVLVTNHPAAGGSHLPDITVVTPVFRNGKVIFFVASRGHHAEIGGITPGSMPPFSKAIWEEGAAIKAFKLVKGGEFQEEGITRILRAEVQAGQQQINSVPGTRKLEDNLSDLRAQVAANQRGITLIGELIDHYGLDVVQAYMGHVQANAEAAVREMLRSVARSHRRGDVGDGDESVVVLEAEDYMDDGSAIRLKLTIDAEKGEARFDFAGTGPEVYGNWNAPEAVTAAAVIYSLRCLVDVEIPLNQGCLAPVSIHIPKGSFLSPSDRAAVVGGNVLTSQRVTDVVLEAFGACACSQGCMNNLTFGDSTFGYYETIGGGGGAGPAWRGADGVQCHMTNTRMTDPEIFEQRYPVILRGFTLRERSGGRGEHRGGDGIIRTIEFRRPATVSVLSERRVHAPRGMAGGLDGSRGLNLLFLADGRCLNLGGKNTVPVSPGDVLQISTPGGGGWGPPPDEVSA